MAPKKATTKSPKPRSTPSRKAKPEVVEVSSDAGSNYDDVPEDAGPGDDSGPEPEAATPATKGGKRKAAEEDEDESPDAKKARVSSVKISSKSATGSNGKKHTHKNVKIEIPVSPTPAAKPAGKHIVFNDDDGPAEFFTPQEAPVQDLLDAQLSKADGEGGEEEEESDSDDDAPEAVSSHAAAAQAAKSAQAATKAAEKQSELQKRKRQQRDAQNKQQAETRKKQQAKSDKKAAKAAAAAEAAAEASPEPVQQGQGRRKRLDRRSLPAMLPDDFLEAASDEEDQDEDSDNNGGQDARKPKKVKLSTVLEQQAAEAESRRPQDRRVGSTVYRVVTKQDDPILAPKPHNRSHNAREQLLARRRPVERKGGFLVKRG
ncbi:hypothetical protein Daus18300_001234 [Diaporthe australafricana]|uniref:Uncharacterized protein n=1 Tax=Diaporthe australafricana TaxID=127596 RepID=A0ABR3XX71_9PEZI